MTPKNVWANNHSPQRNRRSIRLKGYDYSQPGAYFVSICTKNRVCLFGEITDGKMVLNGAGRVAAQCWHDIPSHFPHVELDAFVVMPNHVHGILFIVDAPVGANNYSPVAAKNVPVAAKNVPVGPKNVPVGPKNVPVGPKNVPVGPKNVPVGPKNVTPVGAE